MKNMDEIITTTLATTTTPLTINAADLSDNVWTQATYYTRKPIQSDNDIYAKFLDSIKERDDKVEACVTSALSFLHKKGYITKEERANRESERLNDIRTYERANGRMDIMLSFDEDEWPLYVEVDSKLKVKSVIFNDGKEDGSQVLYGGKPFSSKLNN